MKRTLYSLSMAYILMYVSEIMFTATDALVSNLIYVGIAYLFYFMATWIFLFVINYFKVSDVWSLFLAGAFYGWALEGVYRTTMYSIFPIYISWIGLAWHDLLSVMLVYYLLRKSLIEDNKRGIIFVSCFLGILWGIFQAGWAQVRNPNVSPIIFLAFSLITTFLFLIAIYGTAVFYSEKFQPGIKESSAYFLILIIIYFFDVAYYIGALFLAPVLYFINYYALNRHRKAHKKNPSLIETLKDDVIIHKASIRKLIGTFSIILLIPLLASITYAVFHALSFTRTVFGGIFVVFTFLGFIAYLVAYVKVLKNSPLSENENEVFSQLKKEKETKKKRKK